MDVAPHLTNANHQDYLKESKTELLPAAMFTASSSADAQNTTSPRSRTNELEEIVEEYETFVDEHTAPRDVSGDAPGDLETGEDFHAVYMSFLEVLCGDAVASGPPLCARRIRLSMTSLLLSWRQTSKTYRGNKAHGLELCQQDPSSQHVDQSSERPTNTKKRPWSEYVEVFARRTKFVNETAYQFPPLPEHDEDVFQPQHGWMELPYGIYGHQFDAGQAQRTVTGGILGTSEETKSTFSFSPVFNF